MPEQAIESKMVKSSMSEQRGVFKNIAISGDIGTGKTTLAKKLAEKLGWKHVNAGQIYRQYVAENNVRLEDPDKVPDEFDRALDERMKKGLESEEDTVFESRLAGWLSRDFKSTLKVLCTADLDECVRRVVHRDTETEEQARAKLLKRSKGLQNRYKYLYGVDDFLNPQYFNLVVDTTKLNPQQVLDQVLEKFYE